MTARPFCVPAFVKLFCISLFIVIPQREARPQTPRGTYEELQTFSGVLNYIRLNYPDSVAYGDLVASAIRGVLRSLDPHSAYMSRDEWDRFSALERGELSSAGIVLEAVDGMATVLAVVQRSSAAKSGVLPGDRLLTLNDTSVAGLDMKTLELRLAGERGSKIRLRLERGARLDPDTFSVTLKRNPLELHSVSVVRMADPKTGYLHLADFRDNSAREVEDALKKLRNMHAQQVILDLRGNPGGVVVSAVEIAAQFFPRNTVIFRTRGRKRTTDTTFVTKRDGSFTTLPLVVLIDEATASAAEALAGSLQDHDRALLIGRRSFGKALMQTAFLLPSGDVVWLTIGRVVTPSGRFIQRRYRGLVYEQYLSFAGRSGAEEDTTMIYTTDIGRMVRGGGGIMPDVNVPVTMSLPVWWTAAADSGFDEAVSDSVAQTVPPTPAVRAAWLGAVDEWRSKLLEPFMARVRAHFGIMAAVDSVTEYRLVRILAARVAEVRWGPEAREEFFVHNDPMIKVALQQFARLPELLGPPRPDGTTKPPK